MSQSIILTKAGENGGRLALDPDNVVYIDIDSKTIHTVSGRLPEVTAASFAAILQAKTGVK